MRRAAGVITPKDGGVSVSPQRVGGGKHTGRYFELRPELDGLANLDYSLRGCVVLEALEVQDENGWERLDVHLLLCSV